MRLMANWVGVSLSVLAVITFVLGNVIFRKTEKLCSPIMINLIRTAVGTLTFITIAIIQHIITLILILPPSLWAWLILSFVFGQVIGDTSYFIAQRNLGATQALAVSMTFPIFTYILSLIIGADVWEWRIIAGLFFTIFGVTLIQKGKEFRTNKILNESSKNNKKINRTIKDNMKKEHNLKIKKTRELKTPIAISFGLLAAFSWATGLVIITFATHEITKLTNLSSGATVLGNVIRFPSALIIISAMMYREQGSLSFPKDKNLWKYLILGAIIGTSLGAYLYTEAARVAGATIMSLMATAGPLFALPFDYWINKQKITILGSIGVILTIIGVIIVIL